MLAPTNISGFWGKDVILQSYIAIIQTANHGHDTMQSIKEASRFMVGAATLRALTIQRMNTPNISFSSVAQPALKNDETASKLRQSIETLADSESAWFRNTPPHTLASAKVMQSRQQEVAAFALIGASTLVAATHAGLAQDEQLDERLSQAYRAIDELSGTAASKRQIKEFFEHEVVRSAADKDSARAALLRGENKYLDDYANGVFARYVDTVDRSNDFDM